MNTELALQINKIIHNECKNCPHDIGVKVMKFIEADHLYQKNKPATIDISNESLEDAEIDKYIRMISKKGYGHALEDQRKRVKAGCIIARHLYKAEKEKDKGIIDKLVETLKRLYACHCEESTHAESFKKLALEETKQLLKSIEDQNK